HHRSARDRADHGSASRSRSRAERWCADLESGAVHGPDDPVADDRSGGGPDHRLNSDMRTIAIAGVGLIGGSFGLAARKAGFGGTILGVSSARTLAMAVARGAIDRGVSLEEAAGAADLIFLSQPISVILETLAALNGSV